MWRRSHLTLLLAFPTQRSTLFHLVPSLRLSSSCALLNFTHPHICIVQLTACPLAHAPTPGVSLIHAHAYDTVGVVTEGSAHAPTRGAACPVLSPAYRIPPCSRSDPPPRAKVRVQGGRSQARSQLPEPRRIRGGKSTSKKQQLLRLLQPPLRGNRERLLLRHCPDRCGFQKSDPRNARSLQQPSGAAGT